MTPYYADDRLTLYPGDCLDVLATLGPDSIDSVVTDPPYGIGFMGQQWDQPGTYGSTRSDGQKAKRRGHRRTDGSYLPEAALAAGTYDQSPASRRRFQAWCEEWGRACFRVAKPGAWLLSFGSPRSHHRLAVGLEDAGWELTDEIAWLFAQGMPKGKTTLKPAHEPIVLARKPARRTTPLQIAETLIPFADVDDEAETKGKNRHADFGTDPGRNNIYGDYHMIPTRNYVAAGRWPANVVLTDPALDRGSEGVIQSRREPAVGHRPASRGPSGIFSGESGGMNGHDGLADARLVTGSYSRYFLIPKAGRRERRAGLDDEAGNHHPTVKPLELMDHLVRLVTPRGEVVLDPFLGSGTTAIAAIASGRRCIGIEREVEYLALVPRRLRLLMGEHHEVPA